MFLITTADTTAWNSNGPVLYLGQWCLTEETAQLREQMQYDVLPYHWQDVSKLEFDYKYIADLGERVLSELAATLNRLHGTCHTKHYWRILLGRWLFQYLAVVYDRHATIQVAIDDGRVTDTWIPQEAQEDWIPRNSKQFSGWVIQDAFNRHLFGRIIRHTNGLPFTEISSNNSPPQSDTENGANSNVTRSGWSAYLSGQGILRLAGSILSVVPTRHSEISLWSTGMTRAEQFRLALSLGQYAHFAPPGPRPWSSKVDLSMRKELQFEIGDDRFERLACELIPSYLPRDVVEVFEKEHERAKRSYPRNPKIILTGSVASDDSGKFWIAYQAERGAKLVCVQHGGHYGSDRYMAAEDHEIAISDYYFSWGWTTRSSDEVIPMPSPLLSRMKGRLTCSSNGEVIIALASMPRYSYWLYAAPQGPQFTTYLDEQDRFLSALDPEIRSKTTLRLYPVDMGWGERHRFARHGVRISEPTDKTSFESELQGARLFVGTYNSTIQLETLAADFPTILFWNPDQWRLRPEVEPLFDALRRVGILHDTPEPAAAKLREVFHDPAAWWRDKELRRAVGEFCDGLARSDPQWVSDWKEEISKIGIGRRAPGSKEPSIANKFQKYLNPKKYYDKIMYLYSYSKYDWDKVHKNEIRKFDNCGFDYAKGVDKLNDVLAALGKPRFPFDSGMASIHWILFSCISIVDGVKDVLEIGTYDGKTALILSKLFSDGHVTTVDLPTDDPIFRDIYKRRDPVTKQEFVERQSVNTSADNISFVKTNSFFLPKKISSKFDLIWVDGGHLYPEVAWDLCNAYNLCNSGGWLLCDDVITDPKGLRNKYVSPDSYEVLEYVSRRTGEDVTYFLKRDDVESACQSKRQKFVSLIRKS